MSAGPEEIAAALQRLKAGGLVAFPTETVYGLGADARSPRAVQRVFDVKGRPANNPLIVHVSGPDMARALAGAWPRQAARLADRFWPGPLSIIVPRGPSIPDLVTAGGPTMALRCPDHPITLALLEAFGGPLVGPSANPSGRVSPTTADHVRAAFPESEVYVLDGGPCRGGIESTVVAVAGEGGGDGVGNGGGGVRVLRPGMITPGQIAEALGLDQVPVAGRIAGQGALESPGQLDVHYAPVTPAYLFGTERWPEVQAALARGQAAAVAWSREAAVRMPTDAAAYAARLYAALREADAMGVRALYVEHPGPLVAADPARWAAILDRLTRATTPMP